MRKETKNTAAVNFLGKVMREQPELIENLSQRDAYMLFNYSDPETGRPQQELGEIFGISGSLTSRKIRKTINHIFENTNSDIQHHHNRGDVLKSIATRSKKMRLKTGETKKKQWQDPDYREKMTEIARMRWEDPMRKSKISEATRMRWEDPEYKIKVSKKIRKRLQDPEQRERMSMNMRMRWEDPEQRERMSEASRMRWEDPERKSRMIEKLKKRARYSENIDWSVEDPDFDIELWEYSNVHGLQYKFISEGHISFDEHLQLKSHFNGKRKKNGKAFQRLLNRFSILIANSV